MFVTTAEMEELVLPTWTPPKSITVGDTLSGPPTALGGAVGGPVGEPVGGAVGGSVGEVVGVSVGEGLG
ncbi:MAG: hypothetical protein ABIZ34_09550 [Candidatus Limnocylindrales bacterium]